MKLGDLLIPRTTSRYQPAGTSETRRSLIFVELSIVMSLLLERLRATKLVNKVMLLIAVLKSPVNLLINIPFPLLYHQFLFYLKYIQ